MSSPAGSIEKSETIVILDFGSQYAQLIARRVRDSGVYSLLAHPNISADDLKDINVKGLIFTGGPSSVYEDGAPKCRPEMLELGVPILGICYGMQVSAHLMGSKVDSCESREYGRTSLKITEPDGLLKNIPAETTVWMSHGDQVQKIGEDFIPLAATPTCPIAAVKHKTRPFYGVQFHPEVTHTPHGGEIFTNFLFDICGCNGLWKMSSFVDAVVADVQSRVGPDEKVICGLSGGVDSSVVAAMLHKAVGDRLECIFVDNGLLRMNEVELVESTFKDHFKLNLTTARVGDDFLRKLKGVTEPQEKRKIIGHEFIDVFKAEAANIKNARFLAQGTLYPDVIESGQSLAGTAANIKLHHNVGGLPEELGFELIEPLRDLFKDEVRQVGELLGLPENLVWRHPFPGPGLAVRCIGEVTEEKLEVLRRADNIFLEEIIANGLYRSTSQTFAVLLPVQSVGVMGDGRTYENVVALRSVDTKDFMTADWSRIPYEILANVSNRIINEVRGVNRVVYDISSKPPATIEWE
ncbi:MAG: glutamine-hydrolyzing GMP synthase [Phycisphaerales bacterium]|jgi:GMP synthase (glutamine-hydrolysing)|nr:glutamine-hydrolyzing GMP synthase [Phycisphaerales bacterium]